MWTPNHSMRVWLYRRPADMRKSYNGLSTMVKRVMRDDPLSGALYVFINRRRTQMKCLYFEDDGYCVWAKRLERGQFRVRWDGEEKARIELSTLKLIIDGVDLDSVRRYKRYSHVEHVHHRLQ